MAGSVAAEFGKELLKCERRKLAAENLMDRDDPVAKTFHKAGIVVPYEIKTDVGYRPLAESESMLLKEFCISIPYFN